MEHLIRLLMRFLLVPLGYAAASITATVMVLIAWWQFADATLGQPADGADYAIFGVLFGGPILLLVMFGLILLPMIVGILISDAFAIRSWIFHALSGVASSWVGWQLFGADAGTGTAFDQPLAVIAAGIAAGFAYWAVAGFSAGFYKPVFRSDTPAAVRATAR